MPNKRDPNKTRVGFWLSKEGKIKLQKEAKKARLSMSEYILVKLGID